MHHADELDMGKQVGWGARLQTSQQHKGKQTVDICGLSFCCSLPIGLPTLPSQATSPCAAIMVLPAGRRLCPRSSFPGALPTYALAFTSVQL